MPTRPLLDFAAGYGKRVQPTLPRQGDHAPWLTSMNYYDDVKQLRHAKVADPNLTFTAPAPALEYATATAAE